MRELAHCGGQSQTSSAHVAVTRRSRIARAKTRLCGRAQAWTASSPALRRAARGRSRWQRWTIAHVRAQATHDHPCQDLAGVVGVPEGEGVGLSARIVDDATSGRPRPRALDGRRSVRASPNWRRARCARSSLRRKSSGTKCAATWNFAIPVATGSDMRSRPPPLRAAQGFLKFFLQRVAAAGSSFTAIPSTECSDLYSPFTLRARTGSAEAAASSWYISK
jgi:hypothetical protein